MNKHYPTYPVNTAEQEALFMSVFAQRKRDAEWQVELMPLDKSQSGAQRRLLHRWNGVVAKDNGTSSNWVHGESKMLILLPLMRTWKARQVKRADHIYKILDHLPKHSLKVSVCFDQVRTRSPHLNCTQMCEYITEYQRYYSEQGIHLTTSDDLYYEAMGAAR